MPPQQGLVGKPLSIVVPPAQAPNAGLVAGLVSGWFGGWLGGWMLGWLASFLTTAAGGQLLGTLLSHGKSEIGKSALLTRYFKLES